MGSPVWAMQVRGVRERARQTRSDLFGNTLMVYVQRRTDAPAPKDRMWRPARSENETERRRMVVVGRLAIFLAAGIVLSYAWELAQTPFYAGLDDGRGVLWHCFVAALGDGFLILFIFLVSAAVQGFRDWFARPNAAGYGAMLVSGVLIGFAVEWWGLRIAERWEYSDRMPLVPGTAIGVVPIVQMLVLPALVLWATRRLINAA